MAYNPPKSLPRTRRERVNHRVARVRAARVGELQGGVRALSRARELLRPPRRQGPHGGLMSFLSVGACGKP